jgi:hypothetical protein
MAADHEDLLFVDDMDDQDVVIKFESMYPPNTPGMCNMRFESSSGGAAYGTRLPYAVTVFNYEYYDGNSPEEAARLAQESPSKCVVVSPKWDNYYNNWKWPGRQEWDSRKRKYIQHPSALDEFGCYERKIERDFAGSTRMVLEVVYNPKVVARRAKAREKRNKGVQTLPADGPLLVREFDEVTRGLTGMLPSSSLLKKPDGWNDRRWGCVHDLKCALHLVWLLYDDTAHRQCAEFQKLLAAWRERAEATKTAWNRSDAGAWVQLFSWLDKEAKVKKPRKRQLKSKSNFPV